MMFGDRFMSSKYPMAIPPGIGIGDCFVDRAFPRGDSCLKSSGARSGTSIRINGDKSDLPVRRSCYPDAGKTFSRDSIPVD